MGGDGHDEIVVVTGGSGFLGQHIVRQLLEQQLFPLKEIRVFDIKDFTWFPGMEPFDNNNKAQVTTLKGDLCDMEALRKACRGATTVIHCAAHIDVSSIPNSKKLYQVNVKGTEHVIQSCIDNNVQCLIYTGTVDAYLSPEPFPNANITEDMTPTPTQFLFGPYAATKNKADQLILEANKTQLSNCKYLRTCALRIPYLYGEGDVKVLNMMKLPAKQKKYYPLGHDDHIVQKIYAGNAAWAHVLAVQRMKMELNGLSPSGRSMFIGDNTPLKSLSGHFQPYVDSIGAVNQFRIPFRLIYAVAVVIDFISWILQPIYQLKCDVTKSSMTFLMNNYTVSWQLARQCLGYKPIFTYNEGITRSIVYLKKSLNCV